METHTTDRSGVVRWRRRQLTASGFSLPLADELARDPRCDLHELIRLVEGGCPPSLAARILAPFDSLEVA
jgi:hypothetical protein